jgi:lipoprotein-anchoring transpeptidase ErfK/SrfK
VARSHHHARVSRPLIAALGVVLAVGLTLYIHNVKKARAAEAHVPDSGPVVSSSLPDVGPAAPRSGLIAQNSAPVLPTKGAAPTTRPSDTSSPATRPAAPVRLAAATSAQPLVDAKSKKDAGDLLSARALLNGALEGGRLSAADAESARQSLGEINETLVFSKNRFKDDTLQEGYQVQSGERLARIADRFGVTWELLCKINGLPDARKVRAGQWIKVIHGPFHAVVTKSAFRLDVYLGSPGEPGSLYIRSFPIGLGKDNSTPTGSWVVQHGNKLHPATYYSPRGEGPIDANDPKNPLGGYWMGLEGVAGEAVDKHSYGIHGTIEPDSIGKQASMGCIRLRHDDIAFLYDLLVEGKSKVVIKD